MATYCTKLHAHSVPSSNITISPVIPHLLRIYLWVRKPQANRFATLIWKGQGQNILHAHVYRRMCSDQTTGLTTEEWWFDSRQEQPIFCIATRPHRLSPGVKLPGCEADHWLSSSARVSKASRYAPIWHYDTGTSPWPSRYQVPVHILCTHVRRDS